MTAALLPAGLSPGAAIFLAVVSFLTSALTAAFALGGGVTLLAILSLFLPIQVLVPVHGIVQFASNFGRVMVQRRAVEWWVITPFFVGAVIGAAIGARFVVALPEPVLHLTLGVFLLIVTFARLPQLAAIGPLGLGLTGLATTFLSMFVGATGPINVAMFSKIFADRRSLVATLAAITAIQHALKAVAFFALGVALSAYLGLIVLLVVAGFAGTLAGTHLLQRLDERIFRLVLKVILAVLAADLIRRGITGLW
ncbi:sulfite exporter TauE/SafE family protein [Jiella pacifica]|uniref:Probable membrane transporter protein n=1 Tax=Jiella pacifica TaxID=2696469 RepID=A0A6N9TAI0_9HYPH|nr:sulfite exporter TauE/SafE family protein [Jiella pacifica]NDW07225.1 TSUP family transporter [Jiella pacifica]